MAEDATDIQAQQEAVEFTSRLIQFDTQNAGDNRARETEAAQWVADRLAEVGIRSTLVDSAPGRTNLIADIPGENPDLPVLLIHGHLDTVPARLEDWSVDPLGGDIHPDVDGVECVWGRGAIDMKDMVGMSLAALRAVLRSGGKPHRSVSSCSLMRRPEDSKDPNGLHSIIPNGLTTSAPSSARPADLADTWMGAASTTCRQVRKAHNGSGSTRKEPNRTVRRLTGTMRW